MTLDAGRYAMVLDKDVRVPTRDGTVLRANVFRPDSTETFPVLMTFGPYGKDIHLSQFMPEAWEHLKKRHPDILAASSCKHLVFETPDPEMWVSHGYIIIKVNSRGSGKSPGKLDVNSPAEFQDFYDAIEWAGVQPWSNGKVGLLGISYYAAGQWMVAAMRPPHLAALLPWQGTFDFYRDRTRQDGIFASGFLGRWWPRSVLRNQHGNPDSPFLDIVTGERNTGPVHLSPQELAANRVDYIQNVLDHPLLDDWYRARIPESIEDHSSDLRGRQLGRTRPAPPRYDRRLPSGVFARKVAQDSGWFLFHHIHRSKERRHPAQVLRSVPEGPRQRLGSRTKVSVELRAPGEQIKRLMVGPSWPLPETKWTYLHLDAQTMSLGAAPAGPGFVRYEALSDGITFSTPPLESGVEIAGPVKARMWVSSSTEDMDLFVTLRAFDAQGQEITFISAIDPKCPLSQGWLRVSHRKLDKEESTEYRPVHTHDEVQKLLPGQIYPVDVEIWSTSIALEPGCILALTIQGRDFERADEPGPYKGSGILSAR